MTGEMVAGAVPFPVRYVPKSALLSNSEPQITSDLPIPGTASKTNYPSCRSKGIAV